jgi:hypothetical protein
MDVNYDLVFIVIINLSWSFFSARPVKVNPGIKASHLTNVHGFKNFKKTDK